MRLGDIAARGQTLTNRAAMKAALGIVDRQTPCHRIVNADGDRAKLYVYDVIGGWDLDADTFVRDVHSITAPSMDVHINSPGGYVFDGVAMYEALKNHPAEVHVSVDGLAASAASFLSQAGTTVKVAKAGRFMIHDAQGVGIGNSGDLREYADLLDEVSDTIAGVYADRAGSEPSNWRAAMLANNRAGTWYNADEAITAKLADGLTGDTNGESNAIDSRTRLIRARARIALGGAK